MLKANRWVQIGHTLLGPVPCGSLVVWLTGEHHLKDRPGIVGDGHRPVVGRDDLSDDGETQTRSARSPYSRGIASSEALEQGVVQLGSDALAVVANGDEGDPGSYLDRLLMERDPHGVLEGVALASLACGADRGYVYVRSEYPAARDALRSRM